jgi:hypothetical protein
MLSPINIFLKVLVSKKHEAIKINKIACILKYTVTAIKTTMSYIRLYQTPMNHIRVTCQNYRAFIRLIIKIVIRS